MNFLYSTPGVHTNNFGMYEALTSKGNNLTVISPRIKQSFIEMWPEVTFITIDQKKLKFIPTKSNKHLAFTDQRNLSSIIEKANPDIFILRDTNAVNAQISFLAKKRGAVVINYYQKRSEQSFLKGNLWKIATKLFISKYRYTTAVSDANEVLAENTHFIPFSVYTKTLGTRIDPDRSVSIPIKVIVVAKLDQKRKNIPFLIKSLLPFLKERKVTLSLYGALRNEDSEIYKEIVQLIEEHELHESITIHASVDYVRLLNDYTSHDLFILPSYDEPAAISHFEAMARGLPVIVSNDNGSNYVVKENENGFIFDYKDSDDLRSKVQYFIDHPQLIDEFGKKARQTINENYLPVHYLKRLEDLIHKIKNNA